MYGISGIGSSGSNPYQWLAMAGYAQGQSTSTAAASDSTTSSSSTDGQDSLKTQIQSAILSALQTAESSGDTTDFRTIIKDAIDNTLKANGINVPSADSSTTSSSTSDTSAASDSTSSSGTTTSSNSLNQQIEAAIVSALQNAQSSGDTTDFGQLIQNAVNTTLQNNGIDTSQLQQQSAMGGMMPPPPPGGDGTSTGSSTTATSATSNTTGTSGGTSSSSTTSTSEDSLSELIQTLLASLGNGSGNTLQGFLVDTQA
jgi:hypothetical protein